MTGPPKTEPAAITSLPVSVLAFFEHWFSAHGEGSAGSFFASTPELDLGGDDPAGAPTPELSLTTWLKPFDLAVSQRTLIAMPFDPVTGARLTLTRTSGTREAWVRLNETFVAGLRRHFLHWRAVTEAEELALFAEARALLETRHPELRPASAEATT